VTLYPKHKKLYSQHIAIYCDFLLEDLFYLFKGLDVSQGFATPEVIPSQVNPHPVAHLYFEQAAFCPT
jgi:hypothetical protein